MEKWKVSQSCPKTLRDRMDYSLPGSSIHGIFQARVLEQVAISFARRDCPEWRRNDYLRTGQRQICLCPSLALPISRGHCLSTSPHFISDSSKASPGPPPTPTHSCRVHRSCRGPSPRGSSYSPWRMWRWPRRITRPGKMQLALPTKVGFPDLSSGLY